MSTVSKAALVAMLALGGVATIATASPAAIQKKKKGEEGAPALKVGDEFRKAAQAAQTALQANDIATAETQLTAAEALIKNDDEKFFAAQLRLPLEARKKNNAGIKQALDVLLADPRTQDKPRLTFVRGSIARDEKDNAGALRYLTQARDAGYQDENLALMIAQTQIDSGNIQGGIAELDKAVQAKKAAGQPVPDDWYDYAIAKLYGAKDSAGVSKWLRAQLTDYPTAKNWRRSLGVYRDSAQLDKAGKLDMYRLMRATKSMADQNDYLEYADIAYEIGLPFETKAVIDEGRASGKVPAGGSSAQLYANAQSAIKAEGSLASLETKAKAGANGRPASQLGDAYLGSGNWTKAIEFYNLALQKGGVTADDVNLRLGTAMANAGQKDQAKAAFDKVTTQPKAEIATFWKLWLDKGATAGAAPAN